MMTHDHSEEIAVQLSELRTMVAEIHILLASPREARESYTVEEVAAMLGKKPYTVREWCREGRIRAAKRPERRGGAELWSIPAVEVTRYRDEGLLPLPRSPHHDAA